MRMTMPALTQDDKNRWHARKVIPTDVRREYRRLFGPGWEAKLTLPRGTPALQARIRFTEWLSEIDTRIANLRYSHRGQARGLTHKEARALSGEWYAWFMARDEAKANDPERWSEVIDSLVDELQDAYAEAMWNSGADTVEHPKSGQGQRGRNRPLHCG